MTSSPLFITCVKWTENPSLSNENDQRDEKALFGGHLSGREYRISKVNPVYNECKVRDDDSIITDDSSVIEPTYDTIELSHSACSSMVNSDCLSYDIMSDQLDSGVSSDISNGDSTTYLDICPVIKNVEQTESGAVILTLKQKPNLSAFNDILVEGPNIQVHRVDSFDYGNTAHDTTLSQNYFHKYYNFPSENQLRKSLIQNGPLPDSLGVEIPSQSDDSNFSPISSIFSDLEESLSSNKTPPQIDRIEELYSHVVEQITPNRFQRSSSPGTPHLCKFELNNFDNGGSAANSHFMTDVPTTNGYSHDFFSRGCVFKQPPSLFQPNSPQYSDSDTDSDNSFCQYSYPKHVKKRKKARVNYKCEAEHSSHVLEPKELKSILIPMHTLDNNNLPTSTSSSFQTEKTVKGHQPLTEQKSVTFSEDTIDNEEKVKRFEHETIDTPYLLHEGRFEPEANDTPYLQHECRVHIPHTAHYQTGSDQVTSICCKHHHATNNNDKGAQSFNSFYQTPYQTTSQCIYSQDQIICQSCLEQRKRERLQGRRRFMRWTLCIFVTVIVLSAAIGLTVYFTTKSS